MKPNGYNKNYTEFLERKRIVDVATGFEPTKLSELLFPFQADIDRWACRRGRAALFEDCGLGKTPQQLVWANQVLEHTGENQIIFAPLGVTHQTVREGKKFGIDVNLATSQADVRSGITVTNYEKLHKFDLSKFSGVVLDECFAPNTMVEVIDNGAILKKYIQHVRPNEIVINASGRDRVVETRRRRIERAVKIKVRGEWVTSSENHPFFTQRGWVSSACIRPGDGIMETRSAVRLVFGCHSSKTNGRQEKILREILLSEMEDEAAVYSCEDSYERGSRENRKQGINLVEEYGGRKSQRAAVCCNQADGDSWNARASKWDIESDGSQAECARREWDGFDKTAGNNACGSSLRMDAGICGVTRKAQDWLSDMLQVGFRQSDAEAEYRGGWQRTSEGERHKEGYDVEFARVDSVEILERGHFELEQWRDADGFVYFYDIEAARHPSFSVSGLLVHNSSILKSFAGATRNLIIESAARVPFKLACTATPAPNDYMELGNHAEFLGVMSRSEMLSTFFVHDGGETAKWRLKGHAEMEFWKWLCSWAVNIRKPSDLGYDDGKFKLPALNMQEHVVRSNQKMDGYLFALPASSLQERRDARRASLGERVRMAADLATDEQWVYWCNLNVESEALAKILGAEEIRGNTSEEERERILLGFLDGSVRRVVTKPSLWGFGMNLQCCYNTALVGLSDSWEQFYQVLRRFHRFGQKKKVNAHIIISDLEGAVLANIKRKDQDAQRMANEMVDHMADISSKEIRGSVRETIVYNPTVKMTLPKWL